MQPFPGLFVVLVDEPGRDIRMLPGLFHTADDAVHENVSFQEYPHANRFLIAQVVARVGPVTAIHAIGGPERDPGPPLQPAAI